MRKLPKNRESLAMMLGVTQRFLEFCDSYVQRQELRRETQRKLIENPGSIEKLGDLLNELGRVTRQRWAEGGPSHSLLFGYVDLRRIDGLYQARSYALADMKSIGVPTTIAGFNTYLTLYGKLIAADAACLKPYRELRREIVAALELAADTRADTFKKVLKYVPRNPLVIRLFIRLEELKQSGEDFVSEIAVAIEVSGGDEVQAQSLLRSLRRFRKRLAAV